MSLLCRLGLHDKTTWYAGVGAGQWCGAWHMHGGYRFKVCLKPDCGRVWYDGQYFLDEMTATGDQHRRGLDNENLKPDGSKDEGHWILTFTPDGQPARVIRHPRYAFDLITIVPHSDGSYAIRHNTLGPWKINAPRT